MYSNAHLNLDEVHCTRARRKNYIKNYLCKYFFGQACLVSFFCIINFKLASNRLPATIRQIMLNMEILNGNLISVSVSSSEAAKFAKNSSTSSFIMASIPCLPKPNSFSVDRENRRNFFHSSPSVMMIPQALPLIPLTLLIK
jgi:hypothetical protein